MDKEKRDILIEVAKNLGKSPSKEEFASVIRSVLETMKKLKDSLLGEIAKLSSKHSDMEKEMSKMMKETIQNMKKSHSEMMKYHEKEMQRMKMEMASMKDDVESKIPKVPDLNPVHEMIESVRRDIPEIPEEITASKVRDKLETLKGEERLDKSAIRGLEEELKKAAGTNKVSGTLGFGVRRIFQPYVDDFSDLTDGSTKTFYLSRAPLKANATMVWGTDFPTILRPTIDFTVAGKLLTLTDEVAAPGNGATLMISYYS